MDRRTDGQTDGNGRPISSSSRAHERPRKRKSRESVSNKSKSRKVKKRKTDKSKN